MDIEPIKNERDYEQALRRVEALWKSQEDSAASDELDVLATLIEAYEREHYPVDMPDPVEAIKFRLEQEGKDFRVTPELPIHALCAAPGENGSTSEMETGD